MLTLKSGAMVDAAAAALFAAGCTTSPMATMADAGSVKCSGVNSCKGTSECKAATNECKGQNSCKGQGWVSKASSSACTSAGGKVVS